MPPPTPAERQVHALRRLGAQFGPLGEVLTIRGLSVRGGRASIDPAEQRDLDAVVALLREYPSTELLLLGYADGRDGSQYDAWTSLVCAEAVRGALLERGVSAARIRVRGLGSADQVAARNPRVDLVFSNLEGLFLPAADRSAAG